MTYPDFYVANVINEYFIPVRLNVEKEKELVAKYQVVWTPNINILDSKENLVYHLEGWLPPLDYVPMLMVALGHLLLRREKIDEAIPIFKEVADKFPGSAFCPEAFYYLGVGRYLASHKAEDLLEEWKRLQTFFPSSTWAIRSNI